ncbi:nuclear transport factor 2 family protein [Flammeovirgaceae bacterium SG7u.111]|nr:nuclear transport factor 2 family protein [Flammeovirgaceae bacterium SG7u.132]WPO38187.1 nuclear transport factor 2 family protein [Flammeovirgaceae bacterium SG7u.111]
MKDEKRFFNYLKGTTNEKTVIEFLKMLEARKSSNELDKFYHPETEQIEYPNTLTKTLTKRGLNDLKDASEKGSKILTSESYEVKNLLSVNNTVVLECIWYGKLAIPIGKLNAGDQMKAYFAQFFEFKDGKIFKQRNYDCFEPFI